MLSSAVHILFGAVANDGKNGKNGGVKVGKNGKNGGVKVGKNGKNGGKNGKNGKKGGKNGGADPTDATFDSAEADPALLLAVTIHLMFELATEVVDV